MINDFKNVEIQYFTLNPNLRSGVQNQSIIKNGGPADLKAKTVDMKSFEQRGSHPTSRVVGVQMGMSAQEPAKSLGHDHILKNGFNNLFPEKNGDSGNNFTKVDLKPQSINKNNMGQNLQKMNKPWDVQTIQNQNISNFMGGLAKKSQTFLEGVEQTMFQITKVTAEALQMEQNYFDSQMQLLPGGALMMHPGFYPKVQGNYRFRMGGNARMLVKSDATTDGGPEKTEEPKQRERTYIMIKPDGVQRRIVGQIIDRFEKRGLKMVGMKLYKPPREMFEKHYGHLADKPFFNDLVDYASSGPICAMVWEGNDAVEACRQMLGATKPLDATPGTIRADFGLDIGRNVIHGSDSLENAATEIAFWFKEEELVQWQDENEKWQFE